MEQSLAKTSNPLLGVTKDGVLNYANDAAEPLLREWGVKVGGNLPSNLTDLVQRVISLDSPEKLEVKVGNKVYLVVFSPFPQKECISISGFVITEQRECEEKIQKNEEKYSHMAATTQDSNVTERKQAEEVLFQSEQNYRLLYETMLQGVVYQDANGKIISMNPAAERILGKTSGEFLGSSSVDEEYHTIREDGSIFPGFEHPAMVSLQTGQKVQDVVMGVYNPREKSYLWINISAVPLFRSGEDKPFQVYTLFEDITERKQMEEKTRQRAEEIETLMEIAPAAIFFAHDPKCHNITGNRTANELYEAKSGENISANITPIRRFFRKGHEFSADELPMQQAASKNIDVWNEEIDVLLPSGKYRTFLGSASPLHGPEGNVRGSVGTFIDITERKKVEAKQEETLENLENLVKERTSELQKAYKSLKESEKGLTEAQRMAHIGSWKWDLLTDKISWSDEMYRIFGLKSQEDLSFDKILNYIHPDDREYLHNARHEALKGEKPNILIEVRIVSADGEIRIIHGHSEVIFNEESKPIQIIGTVQDVTERQQAEEERNQLLQNIDEQRAYLQAIIDSLPVGLWIADATGKLIFSNTVASKIWGGKIPFSKKVDEYNTYKAWWSETGERITAEGMPLVRAIQGKTHFERVVDFERFDGTRGTQLVSSAPIQISNGTILGGVAIVQDITELKKAEEALRESEERFNLAVKAAQEGVWDWNIETDEVWYSSRYKEMLGYSEDEIEHYLSAWLRLLHPDDKERSLQIVDAVMRGERNFELEFRLRHKDGHYLSILSRGYPVRRESDGKIVRIVGTHFDLTEIKRAEQALKLSEERYRIVAEQTGQIVYDYDVENNDVCWAGNIKEFTGYDPEKFRNMTLSRKSRVHPEDLDKLQNKIKMYMKYGGSYRSEYRIRKSNGSYIFVEDHGVCLKDEKGKVNRVLGTIKDITERKLSQERLEMSERKYRSFVENFRGIVYQADENFIPQFLHGAVEEITGYSEEEFMAEIPWKEIIEPEYLPIIHNDEIKLRASTDICTIEREFRIKNRKGKTKWVHEICQKIPGENGKIIYQGVIYDITERKQAEETLAKYEIARKKEIHHRIKNNLQIISALLDLQAEKLKSRTDISISELLHVFKESQDRVLSMALIHEELYRGGETDKLNFSSYVGKLAENLILTYRVGNKDINLDLDLEENTFFDTDTAIHLGMVINELVSNSFKYAFQGRDTGKIKISLLRDEKRKSKNKGYISNAYILSVSDNGVGIPEDIDIENLDSLGLQLVTSLADQLDGELEIKRNNGTEFNVKFTVTEEYNQE